MKGAAQVFAIVGERPAVCTCPKRDCVRHGDCQRCRDYHLHSRRPWPPYCERQPNWFKRLFGL
jgi:hypothetical protein